MAIFNSYVSLPEGTQPGYDCYIAMEIPKINGGF